MNKKTISVILASRGRLNSLLKTLDSIIDKCKNIENIEILIKIDDDDLETINGLESYDKKEFIKIIVSDKKGGYSSLDEFYNELYENTIGEFVFFMNDDATIMTENWDELIEPFKGQFVCLHNNQTYPFGMVSLFPVVSKKILDVIGHATKSVFYDGYLLSVLDGLNLFKNIDLSIHHIVIDDDSTKKKLELLDTWRKTEWEPYTKNHFVLQDRNKIINYLENNSN